MKKCPNCQREFPDAMRFCQTDGTPLGDAVVETPEVDPLKTQVVRQDELADLIPPADPFKTMVASNIEEKDDDDDVLQLPQNFDPMATMVVAPIGQDQASIEDLVPEPPVFDAIKEEIKPEAPSAQFDMPVSAPVIEPPAPVFSEPVVEPPSFEAPRPTTADHDVPATVFQSPFDTPPPTPPVDVPPPFEPSAPDFGSSAQNFGSPDPAPSFEAPQAPFSPATFDQPAPPVPAASFNDPWNPSSAPVAASQPSAGMSAPYQPGSGLSSPSSTMAIISLVAGLLALVMFVPTIVIIWCGIFPLGFGLAGVIVGFLARGRAKSMPDQYGGSGMALGGIISGGLALLATIGWVVLWVLLIFGMLSLGAITG